MPVLSLKVVRLPTRGHVDLNVIAPGDIFEVDGKVHLAIETPGSFPANEKVGRFLAVDFDGWSLSYFLLTPTPGEPLGTVKLILDAELQI